MKPLVILLQATVLFACSSNTTQPPDPAGHVVVYVYFDGSGLADRTLEILETGAKAVTGEDGLAEFDLPPGRYTLRSYVNAGGPAAFHDQELEVTAGKETRVEVLDCLPCL